MARRFEEEAEVELDATPDEVWHTIATGAGMDAWFMGSTNLRPGLGGVINVDMGELRQDFDIVRWDPPAALGFSTRPQRDGSFVALEWVIEGRGGGSVVLRCVGSGFIGTDDWEGEYEALRQGGIRYLLNIRQYLTHFAGRSATPVTRIHFPTSGPAAGWAAILNGLGLATTPIEDAAVRLTPTALPPIDGVVDLATPSSLGVRSSHGLYRFFIGIGYAIAIEHHLFDTAASAAPEREAWQRWLAAQLD